MKFGICLLTAIVALSGCSFKKALDETNDTTNKMKENTELLAARTDAMDAELTYDRSYFAMRQNMSWMWGEEAGPNPSNEAGLMLDAGATLKAMWFQFWKGDYSDLTERLDERLELGAEVLLVAIKAHSTFDHTIDKLNPDRNYKGCASLAAKLEFVRPEFARALQRAGRPPLSLYDIFVMALRDREQTTRQEAYPLAVAKVLQYEQDAVYVLQLRHNYLPMLVMASLTNFTDQGGLDRMGSLIAGWMGTKPVSLDPYTPEQLKEWTRWLQMAKQTRQDLAGAGIEPQYNSTFQTLVNRIDFGQKELLAEPADHLDSIGKLRRDFAQAYTDVMVH